MNTSKAAARFPVGKSVKINVALQRPNVNIKQAENEGEQAAAEAAHATGQPLSFSKHGTFLPSQSHGSLSEMYGESEND